jgi:two-component system cell cycle response regulator
MKILVVDSDQLFARLLKAKLEKWGHRVFVEHDGNAAYELIRKEPFRMVILELNLPGMSGTELCRAIRQLQRARYTYVIFYTAESDKDTIMSSLEAGGDDYLVKPLNTVELRLRIRAGKRLLNLEDSLREGGGTDVNTGVVNGTAFREFFRVILADNRRAGLTGVLLYVGVENYRLALDQFGYNPTESMMAEVAKLLTRVTRESDLVGRISDDIFCLMLQQTDLEKCVVVAEKIKAQAQGIAVVVDGKDLRPVITQAAVGFPLDDMDHNQILDTVEPVYLDETGGASRAVGDSADG